MRYLFRNIVFDKGGLGDNIYRFGAVRHLLANRPDMYGHLFVPTYLKGLAQRYLVEYLPRLEFFDLTEYGKMPDEFNNLPATRFGMRPSYLSWHLLDHAFHYVVDQPPPFRFTPRLERNLLPERTEIDLMFPGGKAPTQYAVITSNYTAKVRMFDQAWKVSEYLNESWKLPVVYLGKSYNKTGVMVTKSGLARDTGVTSQDRDLPLGEQYIDLRDETSLIEAAAILADASVVVGVDNGLMHLAASVGAPTVMGYTTVEPHHRRPYDVPHVEVIPSDDLDCRFCQSRMAPLMHEVHDFRFCIRGTQPIECVASDKGLTFQRWKEGLEKMRPLVDLKFK